MSSALLKRFIEVTYRISSINTASLISTAVWYYSNTNNIEFSVYFNSNAPRIIPHDSVKNRILYKIAKLRPNKLSSKLSCSQLTAHTINSNCCSLLTCLYVCSRIVSMLEQVRNLVVIKISVVTISVALFIYTDFHVCKNSSAPSINAALWHYLGTFNLDFRRENNSTPGVLIKEIRVN